VVAADTSADARAAEGLPIRRIVLQPHNIFEPLPSGPLRPVYRLANRLHVRTRESTVRDQLLLREGQVWTAERSREAARQLRTLDFLEPQRLEARVERDSVVVHVETHDVWTTQPEFDFERASGRQFGSFAFSEHNLFGMGKTVTAAYHQDPVGISRSLGFSDPGMAGSRFQLRVGASRGTGLSAEQFVTEVPFYSEDTRWSFGLSGDRAGQVDHLFQNDAEIATLDDQARESEGYVGRGWRAGPDVIRLTGSLYTLDRRLGPTLWPSTGPTPPPSLIGPEDDLHLRRLGLEMRLWQPHYVERVGVERVDRIEDFDLGPSFAVKVGVAPRFLGSTADEGYLRVKLDAGAESRFGFGYLRSSVSTRWRGDPVEVIEQAQGRWVWQSRPEHTVVAAVLGVAGFRVPRSFQAVVGGLNGLRAYPVHAVAGTQVARWNLEDRRMLVRDVFQLFSIGSGVFVDGARGWGAGSEGSGAYHAAGFGLRLAPPRAALGPVIRVDLAWPIRPTRGGRRDPVLSLGSSHAF
jgi:hypothetical protein